MSERASYSKSAMSNEMFEYDSSDHPLIEHYKPKFLCKGGEHLVYETEDHPDTVIKVSHDALRRVLKYYASEGLSPDQENEEIQRHAAEVIESDRERLAALKQYFGAAHVPNMRKFFTKIPVTPEVLKWLYQDETPPNISETWALVSVQKRLDTIDNPDNLSLVSSYSEYNHPPKELYDRLTHELISEPLGETPPIDLHELAAVQNNQYLTKLIQALETNQNLRSTVRDITEKSIAYSNSTGETLDLAGSGNIVIYKENGQWDYKLPDALYPGGPIIEQAREAISKMNSGSELKESEKNRVLNAVNYARTINGLARYFGISDGVYLTPRGSDVKIDFLSLLKKPEPEQVS